jgi:hypothetical protein
MWFESRRGQNEEKWKKMSFAIRILFPLLLLFGWSIGFAFQRLFVELEKVLL